MAPVSGANLTAKAVKEKNAERGRQRREKKTKIFGYEIGFS
jgi:hypothetical protein